MLATGTGLYSGHIISVTRNHTALCCSLNNGTHEITISPCLKHHYNYYIYSTSLSPLPPSPSLSPSLIRSLPSLAPSLLSIYLSLSPSPLSIISLTPHTLPLPFSISLSISLLPSFLFLHLPFWFSPSLSLPSLELFLSPLSPPSFLLPHITYLTVGWLTAEQSRTPRCSC